MEFKIYAPARGTIPPHIENSRLTLKKLGCKGGSDLEYHRGHRTRKRSLADQHDRNILALRRLPLRQRRVRDRSHLQRQIPLCRLPQLWCRDHRHFSSRATAACLVDTRRRGAVGQGLRWADFYRLMGRTRDKRHRRLKSEFATPSLKNRGGRTHRRDLCARQSALRGVRSAPETRPGIFAGVIRLWTRKRLFDL